MSYSIRYSQTAVKSLKKLDKDVQKVILSWIVKNLEGCSNPRIHGKPLSANRKGQWRYRVGDYRILTAIEDKELIILVVEIGHRKEVYK